LSRAESLDDEKNIKKYWANSRLDRLSSDNSSDDARNIFSAHPPFNFVIKYGTQEGSVTTVTRNKGDDGDDNYDTLDRLMATDFNERLVQKTASDKMDIVLQSIQLLGMASGYSTGGQPLVETYQFIARDMYVSSGASRKAPTSSETTATNEAAQVKGTSATQTSAPPSEERIAYVTTYGQVP